METRDIAEFVEPDGRRLRGAGHKHRRYDMEMELARLVGGVLDCLSVAAAWQRRECSSLGDGRHLRPEHIATGRLVISDQFLYGPSFRLRYGHFAGLNRI